MNSFLIFLLAWIPFIILVEADKYFFVKVTDVKKKIHELAIHDHNLFLDVLKLRYDLWDYWWTEAKPMSADMTFDFGVDLESGKRQLLNLKFKDPKHRRRDAKILYEILEKRMKQ